jgi:[histone H3]-lysine4 N-trimethyltransferase ASH1L
MMGFHQGYILDATKGSMCRFVNHSCAPNCEIRKMYVLNGTDKKASVEPRMALFALDRGIRVDDELTYDYNFE